MWQNILIMEFYILVGLLLLGVVLLVFALRRPLILHSLLVFFVTAYFTTIIGVIVVEEKMIEYPVSFLDHYFDSSLLFEYFLFPIVNIYFYQMTYESQWIGVIVKATLLSAILTLIEYLFEVFTDLIEYHTWTWVLSFIGMFLFLLSMRGLMGMIRNFSR
ncbi:CBO0543 family protein [Litchfieldia salsa]